MEKRTIGSFIAALRRACGMTQKELGEKLYVSDKTISRWERDECTPDLSLIPAIAEIFGVTVDELIRGGRNSSDLSKEHTDDMEQKADFKSKHRYNLMMAVKMKKYENLTLISRGITILGLIAAILINCGFMRAIISFCVSCAFFLVGTVCQICFFVNMRFIVDKENDMYVNELISFNTNITKKAVKTIIFNISALVFCLPLIVFTDGNGYVGLEFWFWISIGFVFVAAAIIICLLIYRLVIFRMLVKNELIVPDEAESGYIKENNALILKILCVGLPVLAALIIACAVLDSGIVVNLAKWKSFSNCDEFKEYIQGETDRIGTSVDRIYDTIEDINGNTVCEYYCNAGILYAVEFEVDESGNGEIRVLTSDTYHRAVSMVDDIISILAIFMIIDILICVFIYILKTLLYKKHHHKMS